MSEFRKKPVVVEAVQITAADYNGVDFDGSPFSEMPPWLGAAIRDGTVAIWPDTRDYAVWKVGTLEDGPNGEAKHIAMPGDWIIRGVKGELYPCKPDIFEMTYEPVDRRAEPAPEQDVEGLVEDIARCIPAPGAVCVEGFPMKATNVLVSVDLLERVLAALRTRSQKEGE